MKKISTKHPAIFFMLLCVTLIGIELTFSFCGRKKCEGFMDAVYDQWLPYTTNQLIIYNSSIHADTIFITNVTKSEPYETSGGFESKGCGVTQASIFSSSTLQFSVYAEQSGSTYLDFNFGGFYISQQSLNDSGFIVKSGDRTYFSSYQNTVLLNNQQFSNVQVLLKDTLVYKNDVYKIWLAKNKGIVAYQKRIGNELFVLQ